MTKTLEFITMWIIRFVLTWGLVGAGLLGVICSVGLWNPNNAWCLLYIPLVQAAGAISTKIGLHFMDEL